MNKIKYLMFYFVLLGMPSQFSLAENSHHFENKKYFYQMNELIAQKVMQENMRQTPTYQRIMKLCLRPDQLQNYAYSTSAAGQVFSIGSGYSEAGKNWFVASRSRISKIVNIRRFTRDSNLT